jgi:hypothetical protein
MQWQGDASTSAQLLVIWGCQSRRIYSQAYIIEHETTLDWNENNLERFYNVCNCQENIGFGVDDCLLDYDTILKISFMSSRNGFEMNIIISEGNCLFQTPLRVDSNK